MKVSLILACAGKGERAGFEKNKLLIETNGKTVLETTISAFIESDKIDEFVITASKFDFETVKGIVPDYCKVVYGGATRTDSVLNGLESVTSDLVLIHDGARPFVSSQLIERVIDGALEFGGCIPVVPCRDTMIKGEEFATDYLGKGGLYAVQTPQAFQTSLIKRAYACAQGKTFNDDGEVFKEYIGKLKLVEGDFANVKLTFKQDFPPPNTVSGSGLTATV
ncbi:MAG: 2-C-methyl-D-erythritol 4-phosphate cytidylyltransferase [Clostridia bacterium]|nr:2-C-methyl-D-erythritol 4-phosphate cytidylyltransferase [Clostridia bacterium]